MSEALFVLRDQRPEDLPFIYNSWLKSYRDSPTVQSIPNTLYYAGQHALISEILDLANVMVAVNPEDATQIYGYGVGGPGQLHWVYVKHPFRNYGIARTIMDALSGSGPLVYTHRVKTSERLLKSRQAIYNPYLLHKV